MEADSDPSVTANGEQEGIDAFVAALQSTEPFDLAWIACSANRRS